MTQHPFRVLMVEDDEDDYLVVSDLLGAGQGGPFELVWVTTFEAALKQLREAPPDVCLVDYRIGSCTGLEFVRTAIAVGSTAPMVILTGAGSDEIDHEALSAGAAHYLEKSGLTTDLLERTIRYVVGQLGEVDSIPSVPESLPADTGAARPEVTEDTNSDVPRILLIEDDEDDFLLTQDLLLDVFGSRFELDWSQSWRGALEIIAEGTHDIYLVDYRLGERNGLDLVREAIELGCNAPFIVLTGQGNREIDLEAMRAGAADYLVKGELTAHLLDRAIRYAIERSRAERRLAQMAQYDQLTGLANRTLFRDFLTKALARADRSQRLVGVMLLDLDRFKSINDTHGHEAGDILLVEIARRLNSVVRQTDLVGRLGGDEFTVIVDGITDPGMMAHLAGRIVEVVKEPVGIGGNTTVFSTASIGMSVYPTDVDDLDGLVASADAAMYRAKQEGGNRYHFYTMQMRAKAAKRMELENGLRVALEREEFEVHYQPQIDLATGRILGMEALLRWQHPRLGMVGANDFIPLAEECGLIVPIGQWVVQTACRQLRAWHEAGLKLRMAINFSARQFQHDDLAAKVGAVLQNCGLEPRFLEIELTESDIFNNPAQVAMLLDQFTEMGVQVALDDFGTGYSSLNHLRSFPGAAIKIDRSFVQNVCSDPNDAALVKSLINMAHNLQLKVIAEGVETPEQLAFLREHHCDAIQGHLVSPPAPAGFFTEEMFLRPLGSDSSLNAATA